jgi:hypothetical protein
MKKSEKQPSKSRRVSRRRRIYLSNGFGQPSFSPSEKAWAELEEALGRTLAKPIRDRIILETQSFYAAQPAESESLFLDDALSYIEKLKLEATKLRTTFRPQDSKKEATRRVVGRECKIRNVKPGLAQLDAIENVLTSLINASSAAQKSLENIPDVKEGDAWNHLILSVRAFFRQNGLPAGASQESSAGSPSRFVAFVKALQKHFPQEMRRYDHSTDVALATQINRLGRKKRDIIPQSKVH